MLPGLAFVLVVAQTPDVRLAALLQDLKSPRVLIRANAARALADLDVNTEWPGEDVPRRPEEPKASPQRQRMLDALLLAAKDRNIAVRYEAVRSLAVVLRPRYFNVFGELWRAPDEAQPIIALGPEVISPLVEMLRLPSKEESWKRYNARFTALTALAAFRDPRILDVLVLNLRDHKNREEMDFLLSNMVDQIAEYDNLRVVPALIERLNQSPPVTFGRFSADIALRGMGARAYPALIAAAEHHPRLGIRVAAIDQLWQKPDPAVRALFVRLLNDPEEEVRVHAEIALKDWPKP